MLMGQFKQIFFYKPTDSRQYLNFHSNHSCHGKRALLYNLALKFVQLCFYFYEYYFYFYEYFFRIH